MSLHFQFLENECHQTLRDAIVKLCLEMGPVDGPPAVLRTDPTPFFKALVKDPLLKQHRITIEPGQVKNPNKDPIAGRAVQELETELLHQEHHRGGAVCPDDIPFEKAVTSADPLLPNLRRLSRVHHPPTHFVDCDT